MDFQHELKDRWNPHKALLSQVEAGEWRYSLAKKKACFIFKWGITKLDLNNYSLGDVTRALLNSFVTIIADKLLLS